MDDYSQVPIIQCSYNLNLQLQKLAANFPNNFRHTVGRRIANQAAAILTEIIKTNFVRQHPQRVNAIEGLSADLFVLSMDIRLAKDIKLISRERHAELSEHLIDIRRQLTGWKRWSEKQT